MFRVITVSREYGSGGAAIAEALADRLGWKLVDNWLVTEVAKRAKVTSEVAARRDECVDPWFHRLVKALWRGGYEGVASTVETEPFDSEAMAQIGGEIIREAAELGRCVIVGRGSQCLLHSRADAFHVAIYASRRQKFEHLRQTAPPGTDVEQIMSEMDRRRAAYVQRFFGRDWKDRRLYHLMISSELGIENAVSAITRAAGL